MVRHIDYLIDKLARITSVSVPTSTAASCPIRSRNVTGVPKLLQALADHGYEAPLLTKLARDNWLACLDRSLKE